MTHSRQAFTRQRSDAKRRGIQFQISFNEWCSWWKAQLGPDWFELRGRNADNYVMARKGDKGSYKLGNVICLTMAENARQGHLGKKRTTAQNQTRATDNLGELNSSAKLTSKEVVEIFVSPDKGLKLAKRYGVTPSNISCIKRRKSWTSVTKDL